MRIARTAVAVVLIGLSPLLASPAPAQTVPAPGQPTTVQPAPQAPAPVPGAPPAPTSALPAVPAIPLLARSFTAKTGLLFNAVRPERVVDFETVIGLLTDALKKSTDPAVQAQARGWRVFKATEPGPNGVALYVFVIDPAIPGADYGLGRILSDAYPDRIQEIWKLYTGALAGGGSLMNLSPVEAPPATSLTPTITSPTAEPAGRGAPGGRGATPPAGRGTTPARPAPPSQ